MKTLTKSQRHDIYKRALDILHDKIEQKKSKYDAATSMCSAITWAFNDTEGIDREVLWQYANDQSKYGMLDYLFPEFSKHKPPKWNYADFWFDQTEKSDAERIRILKFCINQTT